MSTDTKLSAQALPQATGRAVARALSARRGLTELSEQEAQAVGGARSLSLPPLTMQPQLTIKPGDWAGPLLVQGIGQVATNPVVNAGQIATQQFRF